MVPVRCWGGLLGCPWGFSLSAALPVAGEDAVPLCGTGGPTPAKTFGYEPKHLHPLKQVLHPTRGHRCVPKERLASDLIGQLLSLLSGVGILRPHF